MTAPTTAPPERDAPQDLPPGFVPHVYERTFTVPFPRDRVWAWLNRPETFTRGQVWPFRVEFVPRPDGTTGFAEGVQTAHHGPLMSFAGVLGALHDPEPGRTAYRDLRYYYGSYALSLRLVRPTRLEFWADEVPDGTRVRLRLSSHVRRGLERLWTRAQDAFWGRFARWMLRALAREVASH